MENTRVNMAVSTFNRVRRIESSLESATAELNKRVEGLSKQEINEYVRRTGVSVTMSTEKYEALKEVNDDPA